MQDSSVTIIVRVVPRVKEIPCCSLPDFLINQPPLVSANECWHAEKDTENAAINVYSYRSCNWRCDLGDREWRTFPRLHKSMNLAKYCKV